MDVMLFELCRVCIKNVFNLKKTFLLIFIFMIVLKFCMPVNRAIFFA